MAPPPTEPAPPRRVQLSLRQEPIGELDASDPAQVLAWGEQHADVTLKLNGRVRDEVVLIYGDHVLRGPLSGLVPLGEEALLVAMVRSVGGADVQARLRIGPVSLREEGRAQQAVAVVRLDGERWTCRYRRAGTAPSGVGVWHGEWRTVEGEGPDDAPDWLREWVDGGTASIEQQQLSRSAGDGPDLRMALLPPPGGPLPDAPGPIAAGLHAGALDQELLQRGLDRFLVFIVRDDAVERWELRDLGTIDLHDLIRALCAEGEPARAVVLVHPGVVTWHDGRSLRAIHSVAERGGARVRRVLAIDTKDGRPHALEPVYLAVPEDELPVGGWLTVPPARDYGLHLPDSALDD